VANAIHVIVPYRHASTWVFDDPRVGLSQEPFVSGIPEMIDSIVANIPNAEKGFRLLFASEPFPGYQVKLEKVREEYDGVWYRWDDNGEGWHCPALFLYFQKRLLVSTLERKLCSVHTVFSAHTHWHGTGTIFKIVPRKPQFSI
jgi:hypothetical protein